MNHSNLHQGEIRKDSIGYMPGLDGLRALAVFAVIAYHLDLAWAPGGLLGVSLFFVLSGYLITNILMKQWENIGTIDLKDFWIRRARRLLPALFVTLTGVILWAAFFSSERLADFKQEMLAAVFYTSNWYLIFHQVSYFESFGPPSPLGHLWSLAVEEQFYLLWPLLLGLGLRCLKQRKWIIGGTAAAALASAAAMALIYIPGNDPSRVYYGTDTRAFALLVGAVLAMVWPSGRMTADLTGKTRLALEAAGGMGLLVVLWMIVKTNQYQTFLYQGGLLIFSIAAACTVAALAHPATFLGKLFGWRPLRWLGECSYGIYLWHYPVIVLTSPVVNTGGPDSFLTLKQIVISILLAALSRYLIEEPIRYGRRVGFKKQIHMPDTPALHRSLLFGGKITVSLLLIFTVLFVTANKGTQISAEDLTADYAKTEQVRTSIAQVSDLKAEAPAKQGEPSVPQDPASDEQAADAENQAQLIGTKDQTAEKQGLKDESVEQGREASKAGDTDSSASGEAVEANKNTGIDGTRITAIGDSLMIDVEPVLQERLPGIIVDGKIGRQMHQAPDVIAVLQKEGKIGETVIIGLGTNGSFTEKQLMKTLDSLDGAEQIILVNTRVPKPWETVVNETLSKVSESYPNVKLIDWYAASGGHNDYFYPDGVHLNRTGAEAYGDVLLNALASDLSGQQAR